MFLLFLDYADRLGCWYRFIYLLGAYQGVLARVSTRKRRVEREQEAEYFHESIHDREIVDGILNRFKSDRQLRSAIIIDLGFRSGTLAARDPLGIKDQV